MVKKLLKKKKIISLISAVSILRKTRRAVIYNGFFIRLRKVGRPLPRTDRLIYNGYNELSPKKKLNSFKLDLIATDRKFAEIETNRRLQLVRKKKLLGYKEIDKYLEIVRRKKLEKSNNQGPNQATNVVYFDLNLKSKISTSNKK